MSEHARLSPSGSKRWMACPGSITLEAAFPNLPNTYSDDGTACHTVASDCLMFGGNPRGSIGDLIVVSDPGEPERRVPFTEEMAEITQGYVDTIRKRAKGHELHVEQRVEFSYYVDVPDQFGTADAIILKFDERELEVCDLKTGYVFVEVEDNPQLLIYALAALYKFDSKNIAFDNVRLVIYQPTRDDRSPIREWVITVEELLAFAKTLRSGAQRVELASKTYPIVLAQGGPEVATWEKTFLHPNPNDTDCQFCRAMSTCPAYRNRLEADIGANFEVVEAAAGIPAPTTLADDKLALAMRVAPMLEDFAKAVRAEVERRMLLGQEIDGFGLELGREGPRKWKDPKAAEAYLRKTARIKIEQAYDLKLISPTTAEKLAKATKLNPEPVLSPRQWKKMQDMIERSPAVPSVKPKAQIKTPYLIAAPDDSAFGVVDEEQLW